MRVHILQKRIIDQLRLHDSRRYSDLHPRDIESSHFKYHLNQLVSARLVTQLERGVYTLTDKGRSFTDRLSEDRVTPHEMPKLITYTLIEDEQYYYLSRKQKDPYRGLLNMVGGKMHVDETPAEACQREVAEKTSLLIESPELLGIASIRISRDEHLLSHVVAYVFRVWVSTAPESVLTPVRKENVGSMTDLAPDFLPLLRFIDDGPSTYVADLSLTL